MFLLALIALCIPQVVSGICSPALRPYCGKPTAMHKVLHLELKFSLLYFTKFCVSIPLEDNCCNKEVLTVTQSITTTKVETVTCSTDCTSVMYAIKTDETPQPSSGGHISMITILLLVVLSVALLLLLMCGMAWIICFVKNRRNARTRKGDR